MSIATRGLALFLGLVFLGGALWGPGIALDGLIGSLALFARATLPNRLMERFWIRAVFVLGAAAISVRGWILITDTSNGSEVLLALAILATAILLLLSVFVPSARELLRR